MDPEIWVKMLQASQIAGFLNQMLSQEQSDEKPDFLHDEQILGN